LGFGCFVGVGLTGYKIAVYRNFGTLEQVKTEDGGWRTEDGGRRMEDGGWRAEDGGGKVSVARRPKLKASQ